MTRRIFQAILTVSLAAMLLTLALTTGVLYDRFRIRVEQDLASRTLTLARGVEALGAAFLDAVPDSDWQSLPRGRITWIAPDGTVLWDSRESTSAMDSHLNRAEVQQALRSGHGTSVRYSDTLAVQTLYDARRLSDGSVLRLSTSADSIWRLVFQALRTLLWAALPVLLLALLLARRAAALIVRPIDALDLSDPNARIYDELSPLLSRIRTLEIQLRRQMSELERQQKEFSGITEHMQEGLIVVDTRTRILSCNSAALRLLHGAPNPGTLYALSRAAPLRHCVEAALSGRRQEDTLSLDGRTVQLMASPVEAESAPQQDDHITGAVLILMDVTERAERERLRREFTANVSHELKTPLTAISGTAEILAGGLVQPEDVAHFADNIHREAARLIRLVNDIIRLSRLDEAEAESAPRTAPRGDFSSPWESVELYAVAETVLEQLRGAAEQKNVVLSLEGLPVTIQGIPQIVEEILTNLCVNAITYNHPGGRADVRVSQEGSDAVLTVSDTGVGIPAAERSRVFERFYRVDKSRFGTGTGLGLSIVKHGAAYLGGTVQLDSVPGKGSTFTVRFPVPTDDTPPG